MDKKYKMNKEKSISLLNEAIADELRALHQYMYFHFHCDDKGYDLLADLFKKTAIEEMQHVEKLAERAPFLGGDEEMTVGERRLTQEQNVGKMLAILLKRWKSRATRCITTLQGNVTTTTILLPSGFLKVW
ncbi:MAG: ferritin-like domain-containing protein [Bacteroidales bacterium]|nr:ferritin-like domain-containing protein [Bacteroidales bacterium]